MLGVSTACTLLILGGAAVAQQDFTKVEIKTTKVSGPIYMLEGAGGNVAVCVGDDGVLIVDDEFAPLAARIKASIAKLCDKPIKFVVNTHFHGDHTGGNVEFGGSALIVAHDNVRKRLKAPPGSPKEALPVVTFNDSATVHLNGEEVRAIHIPHGHTDGDSMIFFPGANVVHMGDDFVTYGFPFVDTASGGSISGIIAGVEKAIGSLPPNVKVIPGHGPLSTPDDVRKYIAMLKGTRELVAEALKDGKTTDQMKADHLLAKFDEEYGKGFIKADKWIDQLAEDVKGK
jgi:glyoxylase-like metal-dependent hydrolase (beta-lactamase superfamily II)